MRAIVRTIASAIAHSSHRNLETSYRVTTLIPLGGGDYTVSTRIVTRKV